MNTRYILTQVWPWFLGGVLIIAPAAAVLPYVDPWWPLVALIGAVLVTFMVAWVHAWQQGHTIEDGWIDGMEQVTYFDGSTRVPRDEMEAFIRHECNRFAPVTNLRGEMLEGVSVDVHAGPIYDPRGMVNGRFHPDAGHIEINHVHLTNPGGFGHEVRLACCHYLRGARLELDDMQWMTDNGIWDYSNHDKIEG